MSSADRIFDPVDRELQLSAAIIESVEAQIDADEERAAIRAETYDDGKTTRQRAIEALQRPERFNGEHDVAKAWLRQCAPHSCIFRKVSQ